MSHFSYRALQPDGGLTEGLLQARDRQDAMRQMEGLGLRTIRLRETAAGPRAANEVGTTQKKETNANTPPKTALRWSLAGAEKINVRTLENFTRLLSSLLAAGVPLSRALVILHREAAAPAAKKKWKEIHDFVVDGVALSAAMARSPDVFPRVYVAMVEAGELGGFLDVVLAQIADFQTRERDLRSKVGTALMYPVVLLVLALAVLIFLLIFFIPRFQLIFQSFNAQLPLLTQLIVKTSELVRSYGPYVAVAGAIAFLTLRNWLKSPQGRRAWEGFALRLPVVGPLLTQFAMARFTRMLGTLLRADVPLINALNVARRSIGNQVLVDAVSESIDRVKEGKALGASLAKNRALFPGAVIEMISVAEESGKLEDELLRIAAVTESDLDRQLKSAVALAEPVMLFLIAAFIGTIFVGMVYPIFSLQDQIK